MNTSDFLEKKKNIIDNFNKGKFEKVIKFAKKLLNKNNDYQLLYALSVSYLTLNKYVEAEKFIQRHIII